MKPTFASFLSTWRTSTSPLGLDAGPTAQRPRTGKPREEASFLRLGGRVFHDGMLPPFLIEAFAQLIWSMRSRRQPWFGKSMCQVVVVPACCSSNGYIQTTKRSRVCQCSISVQHRIFPILAIQKPSLEIVLKASLRVWYSRLVLAELVGVAAVGHSAPY